MKSTETLTDWRKQSGWRRYIPSWIWAHFQLSKPAPFIGWELDSKGLPWFVMIEHVRGSSEDDVESMDIAKRWDNEATGLFYQRDWTSSSLPFASEGDLYWSGWWFQFRKDAERFHELYGGIGSWEEDYKEKEAVMQERRRGQGD